jgi:heat-inducible transcriptional repressor
MMVDERKLKILKIIIDDFIHTAHPVGSRTIAKKYPIVISSATIRNEMADLEDLGYLTQPHTSSGRVPSDLGYRLYVDSLVNERKLGQDQMELVKKLLLNNLIETEDIAKQAAKLLSELTGGVAAITMPQFKKSRLSNVKLVKINDSKVLLIIVADSGIVKTLQLSLSNTTQDVLDLISDRLILRLEGSSIEDINVRNLNMIKSDLPQYEDVFDYLIPIMRNILDEIDEKDVYVEGVNLILDNAEFKDVDAARKVLDMLADRESVYGVLKTTDGRGISIKIGAEVGIEDLGNCSVVTGVYRFNGKNIGNVGVIGSKRMDYSNAISAVNYVRETLSEIFSGINL